jgi:16S rRNA (cytosine967-C5)-methyltransferase
MAQRIPAISLRIRKLAAKFRNLKLFPNVVHAVIRSLQEIFDEKKYADKVIERTLKSNPRWGARDRRFIAETTYEIVRWWRLLREITDAKETEHWLVFGAWCILNEIEIPQWEEFKDLRPDKIHKTYANLQPIRRIRESVPDWLDKLGERELGDKWERELQSLNHTADVILRVNTLKTTREALQRLLTAQDIETMPVEGQDEALVLRKRENMFRTPQFKEGFFEIQDASSQMVGTFLKPEPGMRVIDACAGAGGKSLHLAALMKNKGKIISLDVAQWKLDELMKRARRAGAFNIEPRIVDSVKAIKRLDASADRLLLDVPCSGLGVLRRNPDAKWKLSLERIEEVKHLQAEILRNYSPMLKTDGIMVYSTCSILPSENSEQVKLFLEEQKGAFELIAEKSVLPSSGSDGFYMASIKRTGAALA